MTLNDSIHGLRLHVMSRAQELGNVSRACREVGISRSLFYRWRKRYGVLGRRSGPLPAGGRARVRGGGLVRAAGAQ